MSLDETWKQVHTILESKGLDENVLSLLDADAKISGLYGSYQFPETYLINKKQMIMTKLIGPQKWEDPAFEN